MRADDVRRQITTPLGAPAYPDARPYRFRNREYLTITYRTDPDAFRHAVPEPLDVGDPLVKFEVMAMPDVTGLGAFTESGQVLKVRHEGQEADYLHAMYVDSLGSIASGREISAYPKKYGSPRLYVDTDTLVGTLDYGSLRVATATVGYKHHDLDQSDALAELGPVTYGLKIVYNRDPARRTCQLQRTQIKDITVREAWAAPARLQLFEHVNAPLADLPVLEVVRATHLVVDLVLEPWDVAHDYLADPTPEAQK